MSFERSLRGTMVARVKDLIIEALLGGFYFLALDVLI